MGFFDGFLNKMLLPSEDEDYDDYDDDYEEEKPAKKQQASSLTDTKKAESEQTVFARPKEKSPNKITQMRSSSRKAQNIRMEVCVIKPTSFEDAREITETLLANQTVVLNVEGLDVDIAQRIIDFTSGSCFAMNGNLQKISNFIFIITPENVEISGDIQNLVDSFSF